MFSRVLNNVFEGFLVLESPREIVCNDLPVQYSWLMKREVSRVFDRQLWRQLWLVLYLPHPSGIFLEFL